MTNSSTTNNFLELQITFLDNNSHCWTPSHFTEQHFSFLNCKSFSLTANHFTTENHNLKIYTALGYIVSLILKRISETNSRCFTKRLQSRPLNWENHNLLRNRSRTSVVNHFTKRKITLPTENHFLEQLILTLSNKKSFYWAVNHFLESLITFLNRKSFYWKARPFIQQQISLCLQSQIILPNRKSLSWAANYFLE